MSKIKEAMQTYALDLALEVRRNLNPTYEVVASNYRGGGDLVMLVKEKRDGLDCYYELIIRPQPYMNPDRKD